MVEGMVARVQDMEAQLAWEAEAAWTAEVA